MAKKLNVQGYFGLSCVLDCVVWEHFGAGLRLRCVSWMPISSLIMRLSCQGKVLVLGRRSEQCVDKAVCRYD
jgi:hypothetical protein